MKTPKLTILIILCQVSLLLFSNNDYKLHFTQISTKDGLSQNTVRAILEDKKGFIWAGTLDGLNRYDGYSIFAYKPQLGNLNSLIDHRIKDVIQDKDGLLWIKTYRNEFDCFDPVSESFLKYADKINSYANYFEAANGDIWLWGNTNGCLRINKDNGKLISTPFLTDKISTERKTCEFLFEDSKSTIWIGGGYGLFCINENKIETFFDKEYYFWDAVELNSKLYFTTNQGQIIEYDLKRKSFEKIIEKTHSSFTNIAVFDNNKILITSKASEVFIFNVNTRSFEPQEWLNDKDLKLGYIDLLIDKNGGFWLYNHSGKVWYYNRKKQMLKKMELIPSSIANIIDLERYNVFIDSQNIIWITTYGNGLFCYDLENGRLDNYKYRADGNSPASDYLLSITEDRYGNIWIGSEYAGIIKVVKSAYDIEIIRAEQETSIGKNNNVRTIYSDIYNKIWVGTKNGSLYVYNNDFTKKENLYQDLNPYALCEDNQKRLWVGTKGKGLYLFDVESHKEVARFMNTSNDSTSLGNNTIFHILRDNKNRMWVGTFGGGLSLAENISDENIEFKSYFAKDGNRRYVRYIFQDTKGYIWVASSDGIIYFDPDKLIKNPRDYRLFQMNLNNSKGLNCNDIKTIFEDEDGNIWVGTAGGGINKFIPAGDGQKEHFIAYTTKNGMSGDFISGILEDKGNNLWISTESGITKFNRKDNSFLVFQFSDKTYGNHFNENANIIDPKGYMLWGSLDGLLKIHPESFIPDDNTPPVTLTNFFIFDKKTEVRGDDSPLEKSISYSDNLILNYKQNTFTIEFATLILKDPEKNKYEYILENYDTQWNMISHGNTATYKNLPPGKYIFKVKGTNSDGIWNDNITSLNITITPPLWKTWYAYLVYFILVLLALYFAFRLIFKFNKLNNNVKIEKELTNYKLRFFTNISHEFRTPLTLIRGAVENLSDQTDISTTVKRQINVLSRNSTILTRLIDQLLEFRKIQNNVLTLDLEETDIIDFSKEIYSSFHEIATQKKIDYQFCSEYESFYLYLDRRKVDKIIYNLLSNAFKFTPTKGKIELVILINEQDKSCLIQIKDNGIGIEKEKQHLLFSRFMQINFSSAGTGVGLSLVKEFVDVHKAKIWYEDNEGQGSVFNFELSTNKETYKGENFITLVDNNIVKHGNNDKILYPSDNIENIQLPEIEDATLSNYKMLVIDDNDDIRNFLIDEFSKYFMVDFAENGQKGLQKAIDTNPDLIICDVMMPEMDGFEVTRRLKTEFQTCHIPIILLTAHSSIEHQLEGIQSGADAYIMKPFSLKYLVARVFKLIEQREQLKKRFSNEYVLDGNLIATTDKDKEFFELIDKILEEHLGDVLFSVDRFAELAKQRRTVFYKKVKGITGMSPNELIKVKRLKKAAELLLSGELTVAEISYKVGFEDPFYFSKCFKTHFKCSPSKYGQNREDTH